MNPRASITVGGSYSRPPIDMTQVLSSQGILKSTWVNVTVLNSRNETIPVTFRDRHAFAALCLLRSLGSWLAK